MRLIDADNLKNKFRHEYKVSFAEVLDEVIDEQPTVDAERIIRCKDCKFYLRAYDCPFGILAIGAPDRMGYCYKAERKDNDKRTEYKGNT